MNNKARYIFSTGDLFQKDFSICFKNEKGNVYIPIKNTKEIYCFNDIMLSTKLLGCLSRAEIIIHFFGYYGNYVGTFYPKEQLFSGELTVKQVLAFQNKRLNFAKAFVRGIGLNIHSVLYHYYRHGKNELKHFLNWIKRDFLEILEKCKDIKQVLFIEGSLWAKFYNIFELILPSDFLINKRVRRPPDNPMNALISFGNTLLYTKTITQIYHTHLNQTISFLHEPSEKRFSLSLDISESFKPILVFKTIFDCVNNRKLTVEKHFDKKFNYALLNDSGKKIFISEFEERLNSVFEHSKLKRKISFNQAIKLDAYKLIKSIAEDKTFDAFCFSEKR